MDDLIIRQATLNSVDTWDKFGCAPDGKLVRYDDNNHYVPYVHYDDIVHAIKHLPSVQPDLTHIIFETLAECGIYGEEATIKLIGTLKRLGRNDLLPPCVR